MACPGVSARLALYTAFAAAILIVQELRNSHAQEPFRSPQRNDDLAAGAPPPSQGHLQLTFSPWTKFCLTHGESHANHVCLTGKDGRGVSDLTMVAVVLIEPQGAPQKLLRVTLPVGVDVNSSVTIAIDEMQLLEARHLTWLPIGRVAEVGVGTDFVDRLKKGRLLLVESKSSFGATTSFVMPLTDFATAYNGPPADPKTLDRERWENRKPWKDDTLDPRAFRKSIQ